MKEREEFADYGQGAWEREKRVKYDYKVGLKIGKTKLAFPEIRKTTDRRGYEREPD